MNFFWQVNTKTWQVDKVIWHVFAEICHHTFQFSIVIFIFAIWDFISLCVITWWPLFFRASPIWRACECRKVSVICVAAYTYMYLFLIILLKNAFLYIIYHLLTKRFRFMALCDCRLQRSVSKSMVSYEFIWIYAFAISSTVLELSWVK